MLSPSQSKFVGKAARWILKKLMNESVLICLVLFGSILYMVLTNDQKTMEVLARNAHADQDFTFNPELPPSEHMVPWETERLSFKGSEFQNEVVNYLNAIGGFDFTLTVVRENGTLNHLRRSDRIGSNGYWDFGLCQLNQKYHSAFIKSDDFKDWRKQALYCLDVFKRRPGAFYGYFVRHQSLKSFL